MKRPRIRRFWLPFSFIAVAVPSSCAMASDDLDVTMRMVTDDDDLTGRVVREIRLNTPIGLERNPGKSREITQEARKNGREFGQSIANQARETAREQRDRARPERPGKPDKPGKPDMTGKPDMPEKPAKPEPPGQAKQGGQI